MKLFSFACITIGVLLLVFSNKAESFNSYIKVVGFILLMFGLYKSTRLWVKENSNTK